VSTFNGDINWNEVKKAGIDFAIIRLGFRGYGTSGSLNIDAKFYENLINANASGIDIGIYFYSQAVNEKEAIEEATLVLNALKNYKHIFIKYPIAIDTERTPYGSGRADGISAAQRTNVCIAFCETIKNAGYIPMIYSNKDWLLNNLEMNRLNNYDIWLAHYTKKTNFQYPYAIWQYTSSGIVNGINGNVDMNICYKFY